MARSVHKTVLWPKLCALARSLTNELPLEFAKFSETGFLLIGAAGTREGEFPPDIRGAEAGVERYYRYASSPFILHQEDDPEYRTWLSFEEPEIREEGGNTFHPQFTWVSRTSGAKLHATRYNTVGGWNLRYEEPPYELGRVSLYRHLFDDPLLGGGQTGLGYRVAKGEVVISQLPPSPVTVSASGVAHYRAVHPK